MTYFKLSVWLLGRIFYDVYVGEWSKWHFFFKLQDQFGIIKFNRTMYLKEKTRWNQNTNSNSCVSNFLFWLVFNHQGRRKTFIYLFDFCFILISTCLLLYFIILKDDYKEKPTRSNLTPWGVIGEIFPGCRCDDPFAVSAN